MRLCADIGGTKVLLALDVSPRGGTASTPPNFCLQHRYLCADYPDFASLLADFLATAQAEGMSAQNITSGCLALAGPVDPNGKTAQLTNLPWQIDAAALSATHCIGALQLVNDFTAAAAGIEVLTEQSLITLQHGEALEPCAQKVRVVLGAGTGLGVAALLRESQSIHSHYRILPSEGGHTGFAPTTPQQAELWAFLQARHGRVSNERLLSGNGLVAIHAFLCGNNAAEEQAALKQKAATHDLAAAITITSQTTSQTDRSPDSNAQQAVALFCTIYGAVAGDLALTLLARDGVYIAGGIALHILPQLCDGTFLRAFNTKAEHTGLAARMPVHIVTDSELGLKGAAVLARRHASTFECTQS